MRSMIQEVFSIILGLTACYLPNIIFDLIIAKNPQRNIISTMYLAEFSKLLSFTLGLLVIFKFVPIKPTIFIVSVIAYLIVNFIKNLLKLIL